MKIVLTIFLTVLVVAASAALYYLHLKTASEARSAEQLASEQRIRDKYGNDVIIN